MDEIGADTTEIRGFTAQLALGARWEDLLEDLSIAPGVRKFVAETLGCALHGSLVEVAAFFFFGREDVIPEMFERLLALWANAKAEVPHFAYYLERHIELDRGKPRSLVTGGTDDVGRTTRGQLATGDQRCQAGPHQSHPALGQHPCVASGTLKRNVNFAGRRRTAASADENRGEDACECDWLAIMRDT
jgi:hypothetical protein